MRVLLYAMWFAEFVVPLANALADRHSVDLILCKENAAESLGLALEQTLAQGVRCVTLPHLKKRRPLEAARSMLTAWRTIRRAHPEVIHIQDSFDPLAACLIPSFGRTPVIVEIHDPAPHPGDQKQHRLRNRIPSALLRKRASSLIAHGQFCREAVIQQAHFPPAFVHSIPLGSLANLRQLTDAQVQEEPHTILFFGRMREYKGLQYLVQAEPLISAQVPDVSIILAGSGPDLSRCETMMVNPRRFEIHRGFISPLDMVRLFQRASVVVLPYLEASQSAVITTAFTLGKPVVATKVGGLPDVVDNGVEGYLVPSRDATALADAITRLLQNSQERAKFGRAALAKAHGPLSWPAIADQVSTVYRSIQCRS